MSELLHPEYLRDVPFVGTQMEESLLVADAVSRATYEQRSSLAGDPGVTVLIRTRNDAETLPGLIGDLRAQEYNGEVETVVIDACSTDGTLAIARDYDIRTALTERNQFYNSAVATGISQASHNIVYSLVGHSRLASSQALRAATRWFGATDSARVGAVYGLSLPGEGASISERAGACILGAHKILQKTADQITPDGKEMGVLAFDCSLIDAEAYRTAGGLNEDYQAGGADGNLAMRMAHANFRVVRDPVVSVHHTHGLNPVQSVRQVQFWNSLGKPQAYGKAPGYDYCLDPAQKNRPRS